MKPPAGKKMCLKYLIALNTSIPDSFRVVLAQFTLCFPGDRDSSTGGYWHQIGAHCTIKELVQKEDTIEEERSCQKTAEATQ